MSLSGSLFSGISGLRNHQIMLDVIGNNISNVNTVGFKASRTTFSEMFSQTRVSAFRPTDANGGINPQQIGLGSSVGSIDTAFTQGSFEASGSATDLGVAGSGFFIVKSNGQQYYTRVGNFAFDASGQLVMPGNGAILQGKLAKADGTIPIDAAVQDIKLALDKRAPAKASSLGKLTGNLDSREVTGATKKGTLSVYDSLGNTHTIEVTYTKSATLNEWTWQAAVPTAVPPAVQDPMTITSGGSGTISFNTDGSLAAFTYAAPATTMTVNPNNGANSTQMIDLTPGKVGDFGGITQTAAASILNMKDQDGYASGTLQNIAVDKDGKIQGKFSNGTVIALGQVILAEFNNPSGLMKATEGLYSASGNSGAAAMVNAGDGTTSTIQGGALEQSNVDLAEEFTKMIIAQRGYQSNARVITTSDEILQETVGLKR